MTEALTDTKMRLIANVMRMGESYLIRIPMEYHEELDKKFMTEDRRRSKSQLLISIEPISEVNE